MSWTVPLSLLGLGLLGAGFFLGALFVWLHSQKTRFRYWRESRRSARLKKELDALSAKAAKEKADTGLPLLP